MAIEGLSLEEAKIALNNGSKFGQVYPQLANVERDSELLKFHFCFGLKKMTTPNSKDLGYTGDVCSTCGGSSMKRSGTCLVCCGCGNTSGGCA